MATKVIPQQYVITCDICGNEIKTSYRNFIEVTSGLDGCNRNETDLCDHCYEQFNAFIKTEKDRYK